MTITRAGWRLPPFLMAKPKSPWGGGGDDRDDGAGQGGGGDDAGPRNPWAQPPSGQRGRAPRPSSLDDFLRRARGGGGGGGNGRGFQFPGGGNAKALWLAAVGAIAAMWVLLTSVHLIGTQEIGVVTYFGRYSGTMRPGWGFTLPAPFASVRKINVTGIQTVTFPDPSSGGANLVLTGDGNLVDLSYSVQWNIADPQQYAFELDNPDGAVRATAETAIRAVIANSTLDDVLGSGKLEIQTRVADAMRRILGDYQSGIRIVSVALNNTSAPAPVMDAFKSVTAAQNDKQSNITQAKGYASQVVSIAQGQAAAFDSVYAQYKLAPEVTRRRMYYETMEAVLSRTNKTIVEPRGIAPLLPLGGKVVTDAPQSGQGGAR